MAGSLGLAVRTDQGRNLPLRRGQRLREMSLFDPIIQDRELRFSRRGKNLTSLQRAPRFTWFSHLLQVHEHGRDSPLPALCDESAVHPAEQLAFERLEPSPGLVRPRLGCEARPAQEIVVKRIARKQAASNHPGPSTRRPPRSLKCPRKSACLARMRIPFTNGAGALPFSRAEGTPASCSSNKRNTVRSAWLLVA